MRLSDTSPVLSSYTIGNLLSNATASAACTIDKESNLIEWSVGDLQCSIDGCENHAPCALNVIVETSELVSILMKDLPSIRHPKVLDMLGFINFRARRTRTSKWM